MLGDLVSSGCLLGLSEIEVGSLLGESDRSVRHVSDSSRTTQIYSCGVESFVYPWLLREVRDEPIELTVEFKDHRCVFAGVMIKWYELSCGARPMN